MCALRGVGGRSHSTSNGLNEEGYDVNGGEDNRIYSTTNDKQQNFGRALVHVHHLVDRRLYLSPRLLITIPRVMKFAAASGVGAMIVVEILDVICQLPKYQRPPIYLLD